MKLPSPAPRYEPTRESERNRQIEKADLENHKRGRDLYVSPGRLLLTSPDGTIWEIKVDDLGAISAEST
jgi:hypothetical protein